MSGKEKEARSDVCSFVKRAYEQNIFTSSSGSISLRLTPLQKGSDCNALLDHSFVITPSNVDRHDVDPTTICFVSSTTNCQHGSIDTNGKNNTIVGRNENEREVRKLCYHQTHSNIIPSHTSEFHHTIYSMHPEVNSIVIAQPPFATSFCITGAKLNADGIPESHLVLGNVKSLPIDCLKDAGVSLSKVLNPTKGINTVLIDGFGILSVAESMLKAYVQVEVCESICGIMLTAMRRGQPKLLSDDDVKEIDYLFKARH